MDCPECDRLGVAGDWHCNAGGPQGDADIVVTQGEALKLNAARLYDEQLHILLSKNQDYSPLNISQAPFGVMQGLLTRISDKFYRAINLVEMGQAARHESLEDTFGDMMNYCAIAVLCMRGNWPGVERWQR